MKELLKNMFVLTIATPLAGAAMGAVGGISALSHGMRGATQVAIGGGLLGHAAGMSKKMFKF